MNVNVCGWIGGALAFAYYVRSRRASAKMRSEEEGKGKGRTNGEKAKSIKKL
jgi:hypothetical protein